MCLPDGRQDMPLIIGGLALLGVFVLFVPADPEALVTAQELQQSPYSVLRVLGYVLELAVRVDILLSAVYLKLFQLALNLLPLLFIVLVWKFLRS